jgi:tetratricopeptide (TPR) repeat protein
MICEKDSEKGANMLVRTALTVALLLSIGSTTIAEQDSKDRELWDWLLLQAQEIDIDQLSSRRAIYALLRIARGCHAMEQHQLADEYFQRALAIANAQAGRGDTAAALKTVEEIEDAHTRDSARIGIASALCKGGKSETAKELAEVVLRRWTEDKGSDSTLGNSLASLYARLRCQPELEHVIAQAKTPESKTDRILRAIWGFAGSMAD